MLTEPESSPEAGGPPEGGAGAEAALREALGRSEAEVEDLRAKVAALTEQGKRLAADFDNFRKRQGQTLEDARRRAQEEVVARMLDVLSSFDRALEAHGDEEALHQGLVLIHRQLRDELERLGVRRIDAEGHVFDPRLHEAVLREETTAYKDGIVIKELEKGWTLGERVVRPAKVKVAVAPKAPPDEGPGGAEGGDAAPP